MPEKKNKVEIKYNTYIEVTQRQYDKLLRDFHGNVSGMKQGDKYFIKVEMMAYAEHVRMVIESN